MRAGHDTTRPRREAPGMRVASRGPRLRISARNAAESLRSAAVIGRFSTRSQRRSSRASSPETAVVRRASSRARRFRNLAFIRNKAWVGTVVTGRWPANSPGCVKSKTLRTSAGPAWGPERMIGR